MMAQKIAISQQFCVCSKTFVAISLILSYHDSVVLDSSANIDVFHFFPPVILDLLDVSDKPAAFIFSDLTNYEEIRF
jgi:hypothetical protein